MQLGFLRDVGFGRILALKYYGYIIIIVIVIVYHLQLASWIIKLSVYNMVLREMLQVQVLATCLAFLVLFN